MTEHRPRASVTTSKNARRPAFGDARLRLPSVRRAEANKGAVSADPAEQPDPVRSVGSLDPAALPAKPTIEGSALGGARSRTGRPPTRLPIFAASFRPSMWDAPVTGSPVDVFRQTEAIERRLTQSVRRC